MTSEIKENLAQILEKLFSLHRFGIKPGLERTEMLLDILGNPHRLFPSVHVAGTNGKGSTCSFIAAALTAGGYKVGLYTSPHIHRFNERIRINGCESDDESVVRLARPLLAEAEMQHTTFFEITTAMAFAYFAEQNVDIAIIETGLGGRLDSTNVLSPLVSVITSIDFDHTQFLGLTLKSIAGEKAGIIKKDTPVVIAEPRAELRNIFITKAEQENAPLTFVHDKYSAEILEMHVDFSMDVQITSPDKKFERLKSSLSGNHQLQNILAAIETLNILSSSFPITDSDLRIGFEHVAKFSGIRGRIQLLASNPPLVIDVGHNPACLRQLISTLSLSGYESVKWHIVFGAMADKDIHEMLGILAPITKHLYAATIDYERAMAARDIAAIAHQFEVPVTEYNDVRSAVLAARTQNEEPLIVGSFFLADEALAALGM
ncbi:MAG: bifunctional folylpolyglutamate synthase/dihydrofolate synthase [Ignavibacteria bacterium]|nr:bifunctional folylpolyglutamate synthase/dihydrofolate synthase [Ignavibacteria bacterium]